MDSGTVSLIQSLQISPAVNDDHHYSHDFIRGDMPFIYIDQSMPLRPRR